MSASPLAFVAARYLRSRRQHRGFGSATLSFLGLASGVVALNAVLSVMNGFQLTYIESLVEVSSSHLRWTPAVTTQADQSLPDSVPLSALAAKFAPVASVVEETESQALASTEAGGQRGVILRGLPPDALTRDAGLRAHLSWNEGGLPGPGEVALGASLAAILGTFPGGTLSLTALTGPAFSLLSPQSVEYRVSGLFTTGYYDLDASWVILGLDEAKTRFAAPQDRFFAIKLTHADDAPWMRQTLAAQSGRPVSEFRSWDEFNRAFFQALRTEKTAMIVLVGLMFLVVGVNIYFSQKRAVIEHRDDLALLQATGTPASRLRRIFALEGLLVGLLAAVVGTLVGWGVSLAVGSLGLFSSEAFYIPEVPARLLASEVLGIALACVASATGAAWLASAQVLKVSPGEVLKNS